MNEPRFSGREFAILAALCCLGGLLVCAAPVAAQPYAVECGKAAGQPGEVVEVELRLTAQEQVAAFVIPFSFDPARVEFMGYEIRGTEAEIFSPTSIFTNSFQPGVVFIGILPTVNVGIVETLPPGAKRLVGKIRMRIRAAAPPGEVPVRPERRTGLVAIEIDVLRDEVDLFPVDINDIELVDGSINVLPPQGPRPVGDLACSQFLDGIRITFTPTEAYDEIEVRRDGNVVATLPGTATEATDPLLGAIGNILYSVIARRGGASSIAVTCRVVALPPAAPPVEDLECGRNGITWKNPIAYDQITIFRDGDLIAQLPGIAQNFVDPDRTDDQTVYTVIGELQGFRSPDVYCIDNGTWILEVGDVLAPVGAGIISIPIYATTSLPVIGVGMSLVIDKQRFQIFPDQDLAFEGTEANRDPEIFLAGIGISNLPSMAIIWDAVPPDNREKDLPVGLRQHFVNFVFKPQGQFSQGETFDISILAGEDNFTLRKDITAVAPDVLIPGKLQFGSTGLAAVHDLTAAVAPGAGGGQAVNESDIQLTWQNSASYESIRIERNGGLVAVIPGGETGYTDQDVEKGIYTYKVIGLSGQASSFPSRTLISTFAPPGTFFRGDATFDGEIDVSDPVATLEFLFLGGLALKAPGKPFPWFDPSPDDLTCGGSVKK